MDKPSIMVFGVGDLQRSLIEHCKALGLFTVGIDITEEAACKDIVDAFEVAAGDDYDKTIAIARRYQVAGVITTATDKPLVMMARIAETLQLPFYSVETAEWCTDKLQMKQRFQQFGIPCARGMEVKSVSDLKEVPWNYPVIVKPRDNSGSRGVVLCVDRQHAEKKIAASFEYTHQDTILVEEFIGGQEYSIESLHYNGKTYVIQCTEKYTSKYPYNVELGHIQPAGLTDKQADEIRVIITKIAESLEFNNCASHTELKIDGDRITVIETSPRLGGDFITSALTPLSTGISLEQLLIRMSVGSTISEEEFKPSQAKSSGIVYFELPQGKIRSIDNIERLANIDGCQKYYFDKAIGEKIGMITNSIDRYGYAIIQTNSKEQTKQAMIKAQMEIKRIVKIEFVE